MPISIKNGQTESLARKLAELTGETLTEAIRAAVAERYDRLRRGRSLAGELNAIALRCAKRPVVSPLSADEIHGLRRIGSADAMTLDTSAVLAVLQNETERTEFVSLIE